jgi:pyrroline-5-carboxylate reductase
MKIGVIGAGAVGSACLFSSILRGIAREIVVVNRDRKRRYRSGCQPMRIAPDNDPAVRPRLVK